MNKAKLVSAHAQDLKRQVGLGLSIDECEDIISRAVDGYESLVKESDPLPCLNDQRELLIKYESYRSKMNVMWDEDLDNVDEFLGKTYPGIAKAMATQWT